MPIRCTSARSAACCSKPRLYGACTRTTTGGPSAATIVQHSVGLLLFSSSSATATNLISLTFAACQIFRQSSGAPSAAPRHRNGRQTCGRQEAVPQASAALRLHFSHGSGRSIPLWSDHFVIFCAMSTASAETLHTEMW